ncbi:MAG: hypothetical protein WEB30_06420 [Cyclobacteriaceae bacterium]
MKYTLCILLFVSGCRSETTTESSETVSAETAKADTTGMEPVNEIFEPIDAGAVNEISVGNEIFQFENDEIGGDPFLEDFQAMTASARFEIEKKPFRNLHDSTQTDTLLIARLGPSVIEYYKIQSNNSGFILEADIQSRSIDLKKGIRIGMTRKEFFSLFEELQGQPDLKSVMISTMEGLNQTEFLFPNDTLSRVKYQSYFD